jgi:hypothetical protein
MCAGSCNERHGQSDVSHPDRAAVAHKRAATAVGWVHDIHSNGNVNGGHEVYHVAGAIPNTAFQVVIQFYTGETCTTKPIAIPTAVPTTNGAATQAATSSSPQTTRRQSRR